MAHQPKLYQGDCLEVMRTMAENSVDSIVTDPPYGLAFMGKKWDYDVPTVDVWRECLRVLKPGGYLLAFAGTRTQHRMAVNIEDAGFEIRDMIAWVYGSGFPKSYNLEDKWAGWGTALKPALEPITVARKPHTGTIAKNVLMWGTGAINVEVCRIETEDNLNGGTYSNGLDKSRPSQCPGPARDGRTYKQPVGRWPANFIHDGSPKAVAPLQGNQRFFYCAKADQSDRDAGTDKKNTHPTVKPLDLMKYLCRLVTQPGGTVLDPFMGSGTTGRACLSEGFGFVGIEKEKDYFELSQKRMTKVQLPLF